MEETNKDLTQGSTTEGGVDFHIGKITKTDKDKKKTKKPEEVGEERLKSTFNLAGGSGKEHDELKRKREDFAV
jgi:hypothetical protein